MAVKFERAKDGTLIAIDTKTNKKIGEIATMGDYITANKADNSKYIGK